MKTQFLVYQGIYFALNDKLIALEHSHQFIQVNLLPPNAVVTIKNKEIKASCVVIASKVPHSLTADKPVITILVDNFSVLGKKLTHLIACTKGNDSTYACIEQHESQLLWQYFLEQSGDFDYAVSLFFNSILCHQSLTFPTSDPRIIKVLERINQSDPFDLSLTQLAAAVNLSQSRLSHLFSEQVGISFRSYQQYIRFKRLLPLLASGYDLTTAAYEVGFSDAAHLSRECKKLFGIQPKLLKGKLTFQQV